MDFTIPSQAAQHTMSLPSLSQTVPIDSDPSNLDSKVQEVILATSLRYLQHDFSPPSSSLPPVTTLPHSPSLSTQSGQSSSSPLTPTTPQQPEWGIPHLLLDSPTMVQPLPPPPQQAKKLAARQLPIHQSYKPLNMSSPAWRRISCWVTAIKTFLEMQQSGYKPEPTMVQWCSREMVEAIKEVEEDKGLMSYDIILGTELYQTVSRLADANINGRKNQPSNLAKTVLECWEGRFPGMLPRRGDDGEGMDVDE
ncbi:hypothetical protein V8D89_011409 [Ganoderma adspersum]